MGKNLISMISIVLILLLMGFLGYSGRCQPEPIETNEPAPEGKYPYGSTVFDRFIQDSFDEYNQENIKDFYHWMDAGYIKWRDSSVEKGAFPFKGAESLTLNELLPWGSETLKETGTASSMEENEMSLCSGVHLMIKGVIPKFSLKRGFEFINVVKYGERQCFLQSVLIAGILQSMNIDAGVVMVFRNEKGEESNNGHAVVVAKMRSGQDILVDASEKAPFASHKGLFCSSASGYKYVLPQYASGNPAIDSYRSMDGQKLEAKDIHSFGLEFLQSQFDFYRGEWSEGGLREKTKTGEGLKKAQEYFRESIRECPANPLPYYYLARACEEQGDQSNSRQMFRDAYKLYRQYGWIPAELDKRIK